MFEVGLVSEPRAGKAGTGTSLPFADGVGNGGYQSPFFLRRGRSDVDRAQVLAAGGLRGADEGAGAAPFASRDDDGVLDGVRGDTSKTVLAPIFQDERDRLRQVLATFFCGPSLAVGPRDLWRVADEPFAVWRGIGGQVTNLN